MLTKIQNLLFRYIWYKQSAIQDFEYVILSVVIVFLAAHKPQAQSNIMFGEMCLQGTNQRKLKRNSSFEGVKTKAGVSSCVCAFRCVSWAPVCCSFSSVAGVWLLTSALRWKTDFFGESDTNLTWPDAISVGIGEICQLTALWTNLEVLLQFMSHFYSSNHLTATTHSPLWMSLYCLLFSSSIFFL